MLERGPFTSDSGHSLLHGLGPRSPCLWGLENHSYTNIPPLPSPHHPPWAASQPPSPHSPLTLILAQASCVDSVPRRSLISMEPRYCQEEEEMLTCSQTPRRLRVQTSQPQSKAAARRAASSHGYRGAGRVCHLPVQHPEPTASLPHPTTQTRSHLRWPRTRRTRR